MAEIKSYRASHRFARISPTKVRRIADMIRNRPVEEAIETLKFLPNRGARFLEKVLHSAVANAEDLAARNVDALRVIEARIDEAPRMKRIQPHARGTAFAIIKRSSHIHLVVG